MIGIYYSVTACIRRQEGYCCVQYQVCANVINGYTLSGQAAIAILDSLCTLDYVSIPGIYIFYMLCCPTKSQSIAFLFLTT